MKILILYSINSVALRSTIKEHLYSFQNHVPHVKFHYYNCLNRIPAYLKITDYDSVILHYTLLAKRFYKSTKIWDLLIEDIKKLPGTKVAIPQDEYDASDLLCKLFFETNTKIVFTCFDRQDQKKAYPVEKCKPIDFHHVLTGYVDPIKAKSLYESSPPWGTRTIHVGYRARKLPYWFGSHGQWKSEIADVFSNHCKNTNLSLDISCDPSEVFYGNAWHHFLQNCKFTLGCEGGSSILDHSGEIKRNILEYEKGNNDASYSQVEAKFFPGRDGEIHCFAISPRHFDAIMTKTCQILLEGDYEGIFKPGIHYIELKKDYSNIDSVIQDSLNDELCTIMIENCYQDIVLSEKYSYAYFANFVVQTISEKTNSPENTDKKHLLNKFSPIVEIFLGIHKYSWKFSVIFSKITFFLKNPEELKKSRILKKILALFKINQQKQ